MMYKNADNKNMSLLYEISMEQRKLIADENGRRIKAKQPLLTSAEISSLINNVDAISKAALEKSTIAYYMYGISRIESTEAPYLMGQGMAAGGPLLCGFTNCITLPYVKTVGEGINASENRMKGLFSDSDNEPFASYLREKNDSGKALVFKPYRCLAWNNELGNVHPNSDIQNYEYVMVAYSCKIFLSMERSRQVNPNAPISANPAIPPFPNPFVPFCGCFLGILGNATKISKKELSHLLTGELYPELMFTNPTERPDAYFDTLQRIIHGVSP